MNGIKVPCHHCKFRSTGEEDCHENCEEYRAYKKKLKKVNTKIKNERYMDTLY